MFFNGFAMVAGMGSTYLARIGIYTSAATSIGYVHLFQLIREDRIRKLIVSIAMIMYLFYWLYSLSLGDGRFRWIFER